MIEVMEFQGSEKLRSELSVHQASFSENEKMLDGFSRMDALDDYVRTETHYNDLERVARDMSPQDILDVGVGLGITSIYLAARGHRVKAVEPSLANCELIERTSRRLEVPVDIVCATAEVLDQLKGTFDTVLFYSSLHHCDDPHKSLRNAFLRLKSGGEVILFEPVLKFFRTKGWFYGMLEKKPEKVGHYGGNEHAYRFADYLALLEGAGFVDIRAIPSVLYSKDPQHRSWDSGTRYMLKRVYYSLIRAAGLNHPSPGIVARALMRLSLINVVFRGRKP